jgi:ribonucleoside-diphosphate reductase alpha chain
VLGSVLSVKPTAEQAPVPVADVLHDEDPLRKQYDSRPVGDLQSITTKVEYFTYEGRKSVYLTTSFINVDGVVKGQKVLVERPFEFFMPAGQRTADQQWVTSTMRLLSMNARLGGSVAKTLADLREVVWDKGTVRCGFHIKDDGTKIPMYHDSEVAAIAFALQRVLINRGFLDADAKQVPVHVLAARGSAAAIEELAEEPVQEAPNPINYVYTGRKCPECGAHAVRKVDGCDRCSLCNYLGSCG